VAKALRRPGFQRLTVIVTACTMLSVVAGAVAKDGDLDPTFGNVLSGRSRVPFASAPGSNAAMSAAVQPDGKIILAGRLNSNGSAATDVPALGLARLDADGTLDTTFGNHGTVSVPDADGFPMRIALQPDGKIVLTGLTTGANADFLIVRLNADGSPDTSFNHTGRNSIGFDLGGDNRDLAEAVIMEPDSKLLIGGTVARPDYMSDIALVRLNADGSLDDGFGLHGRVVVDAFDGSAEHWQYDGIDMHRGRDGKTYISAEAVQLTSVVAHAVALRLESDGTLDTGYAASQGGLASLNMSVVHSALQADDELVLVGTNADDDSGDFAIGRLREDGLPDTSFGGMVSASAPGVVFRNIGLGGSNPGDANFDEALGVAIQSDGRILVAGVSATAPQCSGNEGSMMSALRLLPDGTPDTDFGTGSPSAAKVDFNLGGDCQDLAYDVVLQGGRPVLVGFAETAAQPGETQSGVFAAARLQSDLIFSNGLE
jgi:uncharacterized delta-60 repeat protein